ncbi:MAG: YjbQ family protein [Tepidanaerobacter acetatoxydans]|uniref:secondary thiamine-phosphate synthase enzyme YjbQ n=1 Tax=Tepidanaerobacter acetatoxydans TaxID=499229 RepID=UPI0026EEE15A|nr:secondary thiamine-phosphate synthase enzyme YjbQ [Tepidanaerobacter acetatoxydans]NLU11315.1 YjbQ family protein [Tepidanaerobacter acetatoxydans]
MRKISIKTDRRNQMLDITSIVQKSVSESGVKNGICYILVPHTTAAVTINESADADVANDILETLSKLIPYKDSYRHAEGNSDAHIKASLIGDTAMLIIEDGRLVLGTWQGIFFCEFDGPRNRNLIIKIVDDKKTEN